VGRRTGHDPTVEGSGNPGATNVGRLAGPGAGLAVLVVDAAKGALAALAGLAVGGHALGVLAGLAAVLGHVLPVTRGFRGGKGVATAAGTAMVLWPWAAVAGLGGWLVAVAVSRRSSVGSLVGAVVVAVAVWVGGAPTLDVVVVSSMAMLVVVRHRTNLERLRSGREPPVRLRR
jgi:glycerol-3-phosphate acyltransferase PlsY